MESCLLVRFMFAKCVHKQLFEVHNHVCKHVIWCTKKHIPRLLILEVLGSWDIKHNRVFVIMGHFLGFDPSNNSKNQNFEKMKKKYGDIIISQICYKNYDHMMNGSWDMVHDRWMGRRMEKVTYRGGCPTWKFIGLLYKHWL